MVESLWAQLLPAIEALLEANRKAGTPTTLTPEPGIAECEPEAGVFSVRLGSSPRESVQVLPLQGRYWDADDHVVFLSAFHNPSGHIVEIELSRIDLQPIERFPGPEELEFEKPAVGYYHAVRPSSKRNNGEDDAP
jgi:hypothetical protein